MPLSESDGEKRVVEPSSSRGWLGLGVAFVIGAVAANVFGFRYSRWAVGKDLFRAWETQSAYAHARRRAAEEAKASASSSRKSPPRSPHPSSRHSATSSSSTQGGTPFSSSSSSSSSMFQEFVRQAEEESRRQQAQMRGKAGRSSSRGQAASGSRPGQEQNPFEFEFDDATLAEMLRMFNSASGGGRWSTTTFTARGNANMNADVLRQLEEMMRAAQEAASASASASAHPFMKGGRGGRNNKTTGFESFEFWDDVFGSSTTGRGEQAGFHQHHGQRRQGAGSQTHASPFSQTNRTRALAALGLREGATDAQVKRAYRENVFKYHPDHYKGSDREGAARRFQEIRQAYDTLR